MTSRRLSYICKLRALFMLKKSLPSWFLAVFDSNTDVCQNLKKVVNFLIHQVSAYGISHDRRGHFVPFSVIFAQKLRFELWRIKLGWEVMFSLFMDTSHGNTNSRIKIYFKNVIFSKIFISLQSSLQTLLFWWTGIGHQNVTLASKVSNFGHLLVKESDYVIDIVCILTQ